MPDKELLGDRVVSVLVKPLSRASFRRVATRSRSRVRALGRPGQREITGQRELEGPARGGIDVMSSAAAGDASRRPVQPFIVALGW